MIWIGIKCQKVGQVQVKLKVWILIQITALFLNLNEFQWPKSDWKTITCEW